MTASAKASLTTRESKRGNLSSQANQPDLSPPINSPAEQIFFLQRAVGNREVGQLLRSAVLQAKLASGRSVAKSAFQPSVTAPHLPPRQSGKLERKCACGGAAGMSGECDECRRKRSDLQTKLKGSTPGDIHEHEADRVADSVLSKPGKSLLNRASPQIQRFADDASVGTKAVPVSVSAALASSASPLNPALRDDMERRFGHDFSRVRVHTDSVAGQSANDVNALAYTVGRNIVFGAGRFAPETQEGRRLLAHELTHVVQQGPAAPNSHSIAGRIHRLSAGVLQRDRKEEGNDPWDNLDPSDRKEVEELYEDCENLIRWLARAQQAHTSGRRSDWLKGLTRTLNRIGELNSDEDIDGVEDSFNRYRRFIERNVTIYANEWAKVKKRYSDERQWLLSRAARSTDTIEAANYLDELYKQVTDWLDKGAALCITDEEYLFLKQTLEGEKHLWVGSIRGARIRAKQLREMMDVVTELRQSGEDAEKFVPNWRGQVETETAYLEAATTRATESGTYAAQFYPQEFSGVRQDLERRKQATLEAHPREVSTLEKGASFVKGGVGAIVGIFVEAAKQVVDLVQILLHFATLKKYQPRFISDMAEAAKQGKTTGDLLKGMVTGLIETPGRFLKACRDGDWEGIGREAVNIYLLAKTIKEVPEMIQKMPALVERTYASLRILRARKVALQLQSEARLLPKPQTPPQAGLTPKRPIGFELPHQTPVTPKPPPAPEPQILTTIKPSRPVAGFGRKLAPAPEPVPLTPGQTVFTEMPRVRSVQGNQPTYGSVTPALKGERLGRPTASATKGPPGSEPPVNVPAKAAVQTPKDIPQTGQVKYEVGNPRRYGAKEYFEGEVGPGGQPQARYYVDMKLGADGIMQGDFVLRGGGYRSGSLFGKQQFMKAKAYFERKLGPGSVKGMRSDWGAGDNLQIFNEQFKISKGNGLADEAAMREAAQKTKTGEWAAEAGFRRVNIESVQRGAGGEFTGVKVRFEK
jgi:hypothetical protein